MRTSLDLWRSAVPSRICNTRQGPHPSLPLTLDSAAHAAPYAAPTAVFVNTILPAPLPIAARRALARRALARRSLVAARSPLRSRDRRRPRYVGAPWPQRLVSSCPRQPGTRAPPEP